MDILISSDSCTRAMSHHTTARRPSICGAPGGDGRGAFLLDVAVAHSSYGSRLMVIGIYVSHRKQSQSLVWVAAMLTLLLHIVFKSRAECALYFCVSSEVTPFSFFLENEISILCQILWGVQMFSELKSYDCMYNQSLDAAKRVKWSLFWKKQMLGVPK